jgi:hypothetical protein
MTALSEEQETIMNTTVKSAMLILGLLISAAAAAPAVSAPAGDTPEHCQKKCMGNDTPTERANCLKTCPQASAPARAMSELPASNPPPRMGGRFHSGIVGAPAVSPRAYHLMLR